jgi:hypothetical protein
MLGALIEQYPTVVGTALGLLLILWPPPKRAEEEARRQARLAELECGAEERHFEERRELQAYGPRSAGPYRLWGVLVLLLSLSLLVLQTSATGGKRTLA